MFERAAGKLQDSHVNLDALQAAKDGIAFRAAFVSFLSNCRAVTYALQKEGAAIAGFDAWYVKKQAEMKADELLRFVHEARTEDFHEGSHRLSFATHIHHLNTSDLGPPPAPNAGFAIGPQGPYWVVNPGTAKERHIPITQGSSHTITVQLAGAPSRHKGQQLSANDPISICTLASEYMADLVHEARTAFSAKNA